MRHFRFLCPRHGHRCSLHSPQICPMVGDRPPRNTKYCTELTNFNQNKTSITIIIDQRIYADLKHYGMSQLIWSRDQFYAEVYIYMYLLKCKINSDTFSCLSPSMTTKLSIRSASGTFWSPFYRIRVLMYFGTPH